MMCTAGRLGPPLEQEMDAGRGMEMDEDEDDADKDNDDAEEEGGCMPAMGFAKCGGGPIGGRAGLNG